VTSPDAIAPSTRPVVGRPRGAGDAPHHRYMPGVRVVELDGDNVRLAVNAVVRV
jgi:hypothetical protein